jgi:predicted nicotinamide N-methyase
VRRRIRDIQNSNQAQMTAPPPSHLTMEETATMLTAKFAGRAVRFSLAGSQDDLAPLFQGRVWGSLIVWHEAVTLTCDYLLANPGMVRGKRVVELGAGYGLPAWVAALGCGAREAVITDREEEVLAAQCGLELNAPLLAESACKLSAHELRWSSAESKPMGEFDVLLAVECVSLDVYGPASLVALEQQLHASSHAGSCLLLCSRRRAGDGLDAFLARLVDCLDWQLEQSTHRETVFLHVLTRRA